MARHQAHVGSDGDFSTIYSNHLVTQTGLLYENVSRTELFADFSIYIVSGANLVAGELL